MKNLLETVVQTYLSLPITMAELQATREIRQCAVDYLLDTFLYEWGE